VKIRFQTTIDDIIAFNRFHFANSGVFRRQILTQMLLVPGILFFLLLLGYWNLDPFADGEFFLMFFGIPLIVLSVIWAVGIRWYMMYSLGNNTRKLLAEGTNRIMLGWRELELRDNRLHLTSELLESSIDLRAIDRIVGNDDYTFVYIASVRTIFMSSSPS
jgi:hypothetical protein